MKVNTEDSMLSTETHPFLHTLFTLTTLGWHCVGWWNARMTGVWFSIHVALVFLVWPQLSSGVINSVIRYLFWKVFCCKSASLSVCAGETLRSLFRLFMRDIHCHVETGQSSWVNKLSGSPDFSNPNLFSMVLGTLESMGFFWSLFFKLFRLFMWDIHCRVLTGQSFWNK